MALKNYQFNKILREYDNKQLKNKHNLDARIEEAYEKIPALKKLDEEVVNASIKSAKLSLYGDTSTYKELEQFIRSANNKREQLLLEHGFPLDYLKPSYECNHCKDTGFIENEKCHCFKQAIVDILYSQSNIKQILAKENFSSFSFNYYSNDYVEPSTRLTPYENMKKTVSICQNFISNFDKENNNLLLYGNTGVGKTFLCNFKLRFPFCENIWII